MIVSTPTSASEPGIGPELHLDHLAQRLAVAADGDEQDDEVLHRAGEHDADEDPERAGKEAHLRGEDRPTSGPAPAIAAKWWPNRTHLLVGT